MNFIKLIKKFFTSNIKEVVSKFYSIVESGNGRTTELIESIKSEQFNHFFGEVYLMAIICLN